MTRDIRHRLTKRVRSELQDGVEHACDDLTGHLSGLTMPVLCIDPKITLDDLFEQSKSTFINSFGWKEEEARQKYDTMMMAWFGSLEAAKEALTRTVGEDLLEQIPGSRIEYIPDTGIFMMQDQPEAFDGIMNTFLKELSSDSRKEPRP